MQELEDLVLLCPCGKRFNFGPPHLRSAHFFGSADRCSSMIFFSILTISTPARASHLGCNNPEKILNIRIVCSFSFTHHRDVVHHHASITLYVFVKSKIYLG
jgi:hypothetical protein